MNAPRDGGTSIDPPTFEPLRPASHGGLAALLLAVPFLWVAALIVVAFALRYGRFVEIALVVLVVSFLLAIVVLVPMRRRRVREEEDFRVEENP